MYPLLIKWKCTEIYYVYTVKWRDIEIEAYILMLANRLKNIKHNKNLI